MNRRHTMVLLGMLLLLAGTAQAQISISAVSTPYTEDFSSLGTAAVSPLPTGWKVDKNTTSRLLGTYAAAVTSTELRAGNNMSTSAQNGIYNYGAGDPAAATDRAVGFISSSSATKSGNLYAWYQNATGGTIGSLTISYNVEKYRAGSNANGFSMIMYYSTDGSTWTAAPVSFTTSFPADPANAGYTPAPGATVAVSGTLTFTTPIAANGDIYLAWNYSVTATTTTSNAQGLGIDDVSVTAAAPAPTLPTYVQFTSATSSFSENAGSVTIEVSISNPSATTATTVDVALTGGNASNGSDVQPAFATQTLTFPAGSSASQFASFTIFDDAAFEGDETLVFTLQNATGGTTASIGAPNTHTVTIMENDSPPDPDVVVNEYFNSNGDVSSYEAIELIVVKDGLDMRGWSVADATSGGTYPFGVLTFSNDPLWANLQAGTIIVIGGTFSAPVVDTDASDGLIIVQSPTNGQTNQYFTAGSSVPSIAAASDGVAIRDAVGAYVHGLAHGTSNQNTFPASRRGWVAGSVASGQSVGFTRTGAAMVLQDFNKDAYAAFIPLSLAFANDVDGNLAALRSFRSRVITASRSLAGTFFWNVDVAANVTVTMSGPVNVGNSLNVLAGTFIENGLGLSLDGNGNIQNGTGGGNMVVGDGVAPNATLQLRSNIATLSGTLAASAVDATVQYLSAAAQTVIPASYFNLVLTNGSTSARKTLGAAATVNGTLTISSGAWLDVAKPNVITLGATGLFANSGRFLGSIRTTRTIGATGVAEAFGNIGMTLTANSGTLPGATTVTMTSGEYRWVGNLPSILKYYTVNAAGGTGNNATLVYKYETTDLNGQTETGLALQYSPTGTVWTPTTGTLNTTSKTITATVTAVGGIWTAHANPPQGRIVAAPTTLTFQTEANYTPLPVAQTVNITNANAGGSIIEWSATSSTVVTPTWLSVTPSPATGVNAGSFTVAVTRNDLAPGIYSGSITITDVHASNSPLVIPVTYIVEAPRAICVGADPIIFKATFKKGTPSKTVTVLNCGGTYGTDQILWTVSTSTPWLSIAPTSGAEGQSFTMTADVFQKLPGVYTGTITLTGVHSLRGTPISNSPLTLTVRLEIEDGTMTEGTATSLTPGVERTILNAQGMSVARIKLNSGSITSITVRAYPGKMPPGIARMRYVNRYYQIDVIGTNYNFDLTMMYTANELTTMLINNPADLRGWRQFPAAGVWYGTTSVSAPIDNSVTVTGITNAAGNWAMAVPYFPVTMPIKALQASWTGISSSEVAWESPLETAPCGYMVERTLRGRNEWSTIGIVPGNAEKRYSFTDNVDSRDAYEYRLLTIDVMGTAYESAPVVLDPRAITGIDAQVAAGFALSQSMPHPVSSGTQAVVTMTLPMDAHAVVTLHDVLGRVVATVADARFGAGTHTLAIDARTLAAGSYVMTMSAAGRTMTRTLVVAR